MGNEFFDEISQVVLAQNDEMIEALLPKALRPSLRVGVLIWRPNGSAFQFHTIGFQDRLELFRELCIPIANDIVCFVR